MEAQSELQLFKDTPPCSWNIRLWSLSEFAMFPVKTVFDGIHAVHHFSHIRIVQFVTPQKKIIVKEIRVAG